MANTCQKEKEGEVRTALFFSSSYVLLISFCIFTS